MEEVEFTGRMLARADILDNTIYDMLLTLLQLDADEAEDEFPWDIEIIREVLDSTTEILEAHGEHVCNPYIANKADGTSSLCDLQDCKCKVCNCH